MQGAVMLAFAIAMVGCTREKSCDEEVARIADLEREVDKLRHEAAKRQRGPDRTFDPAEASLVILIHDGGYEIAGKQFDQPQLEKVFRGVYSRDPHTQVVLKQDRGVPHGSVITVMELAKSAGLTRLAISTAE